MQLKPGQTTSIHSTGRMGRTARRAGVAALIGGSVLALGMLVHPAAATAAGARIVAAPECGQQHGLSDPTTSNNRVLDSYWFDINRGGSHTEVCTLTKNVQAGDIVTANFVLHQNTAHATTAPPPLEVTLVSNNAPASDPHHQTLSECASFGDTSGAGDPCTTSTTPSLTVTAPTCGFQVDLIYGEPITPLLQGTYLKNHVFISGGEGKGVDCTPTIATTAHPTATTLGQSISDTATVTPNTITGTVTFNLYGPTDTACDGTPVFSSTGALVDGQATSGSFTPTTKGTYHWTAQMSSPALASACADEPVVITDGPAISTVASAGGVVGTAVSDTATVTGVPSPTGSVVFRLFGANDSTCAGTAIATDTEPISGTGTAHTTQVIKPTTAGTYQWTATYTGITPNLASTCGSEPVVLTASGGGTGNPPPTGGPTTPSTGAGIPLPLGAGLIVAGLVALAGESRLRRRTG